MAFATFWEAAMASRTFLEYRGPFLGGGTPFGSVGLSVPFALGSGPFPSGSACFSSPLALALVPFPWEPFLRNCLLASLLRLPWRSPSVFGFSRQVLPVGAEGRSVPSSCLRFSLAFLLKGRACRSVLEGIRGYDASFPSSFLPRGRS